MTKRRSALLHGVALATALGAPGCHAYHRVEPAELSRGARVRVLVDRPVALRLREVTIEQARSVEGETVGVENGSLVLSALWVEREGGIGTPGEGWTVTVPV